MAALIPQLIQDGCRPRIMLDYSGTLLWGFEQMGRRDILDALRYLTCDAVMQRHVEWLGSFWGHAVAPSTPFLISSYRSRPGNTNFPPYSAAKPSAACGDFPHRKCICPTTPTPFMPS